MKPFSKGDIVAKATITKRYGKHAASALVSKGYLDSQDREKRGDQRKFVVKKLFPEDVGSFVRDHYSVPIVDAIAGAYSDVEGLKEELEEWYSNLPESFQNGSKGEELQTAIDELEDITEPSDLEDALEKWSGELGKIQVWPSGSSRSDRCAGAADVLEQAADALSEQAIELKGDEEDPGEEDYEEDIASLSSAAGDLEDHVHSLQSVSFPGMY